MTLHVTKRPVATLHFLFENLMRHWCHETSRSLTQKGKWQGQGLVIGKGNSIIPYERVANNFAFKWAPASDLRCTQKQRSSLRGKYQKSRLYCGRAFSCRKKRWEFYVGHAKNKNALLWKAFSASRLKRMCFITSQCGQYESQSSTSRAPS